MKVLQINVTCNWGSTGRIAEEIGLLTISEGGQSYIAYGRHKNKSKSYTIKIGNLIDVYFHAFLTRVFDKHGLGSKRATKTFIRHIKSINPDIIHIHNIHGYFINYSILFSYLAEINIPIVWTLHDCWSYTGHCAYYSFCKCNKWEIECNNCAQMKNYPSSLFSDRSRENFFNKKKYFTLVHNMTIVTVSKWLANEVSKSFLNKYPIKTIYNGIDTTVFVPKNEVEKKNTTKNKFIILGVANIWEERKGLKDFLHLRTLLPSSYSIILIGLTQLQVKQLPEGIIGIQRTNNIDELVDFYNLADVYINFSVEETFGMTTCESMACGTPVIVYNSTACPEIVTKETGYVVEPGDFRSVIECIKLIQENGKEKYQYACRQRVIKYYNKEDKYKEYLYLYNQLLNSKNENISNNNNL